MIAGAHLMLVRPDRLDDPQQQAHDSSMQSSDLWTAVDPLGEALHFLRMSSVFCCRSDVTAPWGVAIPPIDDSLMFHIVTAGRCWLEVPGAEPRLLQPGDFALVPHGEGHRLVHEPGAPCDPLFDLPREAVSERYEILRHGGGGASTNLICGAVRFDDPIARHLVSMLPRLIAMDASAAPEQEWMHGALRFMAAETRQLRPGGEAVVTRLADILVIQAIRAWMDEDPAARSGWLGALKDRQIGRALALVHREPAHPWTLAALASAIGMSRSAFAARFTDIVGMPAMQYVARWRMHIALARLRSHDEGIAALAGRVGYQSEAAFSRAFKRFVGVAPGAVAREAAPESLSRRGRSTRRSSASPA